MGYILITSYSFESIAQGSEDIEYEQFTIKLNVDKLGVYEMEAVYYEDNVYLPIIDLFGKLEIYLTHSTELDTIQGYILSPENSYAIELLSNKIQFRDKVKTLKKTDLIATFDDVYVPSKVYQEMFGMTMDFNFRELTVFLRSDIELPIIKQLRIKSLRKNLSSLKGEIDYDTAVTRNWNVINGAVFDWAIQSKVDQTGANQQQIRAALGMELLGGEFICRSTGIRDTNMRIQNTSFRWRYVNDKFPVVKQVEIGSLNVGLSGQTGSNFYGIKFTNSPFFIKKTFGTYFIERKISPGWDVELYVNGILVNFTTADNNGYFNFEVPLVFGSSLIVLRYYGPWGQESMEEIPINIPFSFTAHKQLEYQTYTGISADTSQFIFNKTKISYGLARWATCNLAYEYYEGNFQYPHLFSGALNFTITKNLLFNYSYLHQSNHYSEFIFRTKKNFVLSGKYRYYIKNQTLIQTNNIFDAELGFNVPVYSKKLKIYFRSSNRSAYNPLGFSIISESALSFFYKRINTSFTYIGSYQSAITWGTSIYLKKNWTVMHTSMFDLTTKRPMTSMVQLQKKVNKKFFFDCGFSYAYATQLLQISFSAYYNFNFMRAAVNNSFQKDNIASTQTLAGSLHLTTGPKPFFASNSNNVGMCGVDVFVFLDINHNEARDRNEPLIKDVSVAINRGKQVLLENDSLHRFVSLDPYANYIVTVENTGFPSISWILEKETWSITTDPNQIKKVYVPVKPMGEIFCQVELIKNGQQLPAKRLIIYLVNANGQVVGKTLTEQDGTFTYLGLTPGKYSIKFDEKQLTGLNISKDYIPLTFEIKSDPMGDYIDDLHVRINSL